MNTVFTFGYQGRSVDDLKQAAIDHQAVVVDVRISPFSRDKTWAKFSLSRSLAGRYVHVSEFGNENYKGGPTKLKDAERGIERVRPLLETRNIILLCACWNQSQCHRTEVAQVLSDALGAEVVHLRKQAPTPPPPDQGSLF